MEPYHGIDFDPKKKKNYVLVEFPYPSGYGLHMGHAFFFSGGDVYARLQRMLGYNVLFPIGYDAFGLPTENYAILTGRKPQDVTLENTARYTRQMHNLGLSFDWSRAFATSDPDYYRWTQYIFIKLFEHGLAEKQEMPINWCPKDKVGLANEEVIDGRCERCGTEVIRRRINQWVVKITAYAEKLLSGLDQTEFIEKVKLAQINWIGKSEGARIVFPIRAVDQKLEIFTTRPDTLWGCTFMVLAPEHELVEQIKDNPAVADYIARSMKKSDLERGETGREKSGVFSGLMALNPATGEEIPVWISDFVLPSYGSGAIMAVPAHDQRDFEFASQYHLPVKPVVSHPDGWDYSTAAYTGMEGVMVNSGPLDGLGVRAAVQRAIEWLAEQGTGERSISYHLRDWIFSRQHYWGEPIPMIYCAQCGWRPVPENQLPVLLPELERYQPTNSGKSPLAAVPDWVNTTCPACGGPAQRETDTMPNWAGSDWYFLRFCDPHNEHFLADMEKMRYWLPVDVYIGGDEHNTLHLLYSRFIYQFLHDVGLVPPEIPEPYRKRLSHGVILGPDGMRMSKSRKNVVIPDEYIAKYGVDSVRVYLSFIGPFDATMAWNEQPLMGVKRFLDRFEQFVRHHKDQGGKLSPHMDALVNQLGQQVADDIGAFKFNTAVAKCMKTLNGLVEDGGTLDRSRLADLVKILTPMAPFLAERCWEMLGMKDSVHAQAWPAYDPALAIDRQVVVAIQINGKLRATLDIDPDEAEESVIQRAKLLTSVDRHLAGKEISRVIYVPGRTLNFVVR